MRIAHLILVSLLTAALVACGGGDEDPENNNPGGSGGSGGTGGVAPTDCGGVRVVEMESSTTAVLNDRTDTVENWVGSCVPPDTAGNDVIVHYVFPEAGHYKVTTAGTEFDTLIYALEDCNDGFTELKCNDDFFSEQSGFTLLDRAAGDDVFIVVDSLGIRESRPFTLSVTKVEAPAAPVIEDMEVFFNAATGSAGLRVVGRNPDSPLVAFSIKLFRPSGSALTAEPMVATFVQLPIFQVAEADGAFEMVGSFSYGEPPEAIGAIELSLIDANELASELLKEEAVAPPTVGRGEACDPGAGLNVCEGTDVCRAPTTGAQPVCVAAS